TAHSGTRFAWMDGYGVSHTDTLSQSVAIPAGCRAILSFFLHIDTAEAPGTAFDRLTVQVNTTTVATFTNLNAANGYVAQSFDVPGRCGVHTPLTVPCGPDSEVQLRIFGSELTNRPHGWCGDGSELNRSDPFTATHTGSGTLPAVIRTAPGVVHAPPGAVVGLTLVSGGPLIGPVSGTGAPASPCCLRHPAA